MKPNSDQELQGFFDALKAEDRNLSIPEFPSVPKQKSISWWIPMGIAASLVAGFFLFGEKESDQTPAPIGEVIIITLEEGPNQELQFNIEETTEMDIWESPTASLLTEF